MQISAVLKGHGWTIEQHTGLGTQLCPQTQAGLFLQCIKAAHTQKNSPLEGQKGLG